MMFDIGWAHQATPIEMIHLLLGLTLFVCSTVQPPLPTQIILKGIPWCSITSGPRNANQMAAQGYRRYGTEKGILYYRLDGAVKGFETIYFDHWGWREAKYINTKTNLGTFNEEVNKVTYLDGEWRYEYFPETQTAYYFESRQIQTAADKYRTKDMVAVGEEMLRNMGGVKTGTETFADVPCDVWKIERYRTTLWMWKGLTLKERSKTDNYPVGRTCLLLNLKDPVPTDKLLLPKVATLAQGQ